jgi:hypothetical protein
VRPGNHPVSVLEYPGVHDPENELGEAGFLEQRQLRRADVLNPAQVRDVAGPPGRKRFRARRALIDHPATEFRPRPLKLRQAV